MHGANPPSTRTLVSKQGVCVCVCVCVRARARVCVCVCAQSKSTFQAIALRTQAGKTGNTSTVDTCFVGQHFTLASSRQHGKPPRTPSASKHVFTANPASTQVRTKSLSLEMALSTDRHHRLTLWDKQPSAWPPPTPKVSRAARFTCSSERFNFVSGFPGWG